MNLLKKPISEMTRDELKQGLILLEQKFEATRKSNAEYKSQMSLGNFNIIRDDLGGVHGMFSHADGKYYDSKSAYYKSLKENGYVIHEAGMDKQRKQRGDYNVSKELKEAAQRCGLI